MKKGFFIETPGGVVKVTKKEFTHYGGKTAQKPIRPIQNTNVAHKGNKRFWVGPIEQQTVANTNFRKVLFTSKNMQLVLMTVPVGEELGNEIHAISDQFFRIEFGKARFVVESKERVEVGPGGAVLIPKGTWHNVINIGSAPLRLYTIYSPPHHPAGTIDVTKQAAINRENKKK